MKNILLACPYNGLKKLEKKIIEISSEKINLIKFVDISAIDNEYLYIGSNFKKLKILDIYSAYIRYPYDLIPPHTKTFNLRENIEFLKTLLILLSKVSINNYESGVLCRNRVYSLKIVEECGFLTIKSIAIKNKIKEKNKLVHNNIVTKSLGNCYYSENIKNKSKFENKYLNKEEDGGEVAYIYPAQKIEDFKDINERIKNIGVCLIQKKIKGNEFRVYLFDNNILFFEREKINNTDKSAGQLIEKENAILEKNKNKFNKLRKKLNLRYLCLDLIISNGKIYIIDVNPFGSLPNNNLSNTANTMLAKIILNRK
jgi:hypothetical protein